MFKYKKLEAINVFQPTQTNEPEREDDNQIKCDQPGNKSVRIFKAIFVVLVGTIGFIREYCRDFYRNKAGQF